MKNIYIEAIRYCFGMTYKKATEYYKRNKNNRRLLENIVKSSNIDAYNAFYND